MVRNIPTPLIVVVRINGHPARTLIDSGSLRAFMSSTIAEQLQLAKVELDSPLTVQLAVQGSRSKVNFGTYAHLEYQNISSRRYFDVIFFFKQKTAYEI